MQSVFLVFPHQLFKSLERLPKDTIFAFIEDELYFRQYPFHKQKLVLHRAGMQALRERLLVKGFRVEYFDAVRYHNLEAVFGELAKLKPKAIHFYDVADDWLAQRVKELTAAHGWRLVELISPGFLLSRKEVGKYRAKKMTQMDFYRAQRRKFKILVDKHGNPRGGAWRFEKGSRKPVPQSVPIPDIHLPDLARYVEEAVEYVATHFAKNFGQLEPFIYPVTHADAKDWLEDFLHNRFAKYGPHYAWLSGEHPTLFHSLLSPLLNVGLLTPRQVMEAALKAADQQNIPLISQEVFFYGLIGEREYARLRYVLSGRKLRKRNPNKAHKPVPKELWHGKTGIPAVDTALQKLAAFGWISRPERTHVLKPFLQKNEVEPDEAQRFFMVTGIDSYDWSVVGEVAE